MSEIKRGSSNVYYNGKEFMHVVRFFHENSGTSAAYNARTRWAFLVVGRDELEDSFLQDKDKTNKERITKIKDDYLPVLQKCVQGKEISEYNGKETITHNLKEEKVYDIPFKAYIDGKPEAAAFANLVYDTNEVEEVEIKEEK